MSDFLQSMAETSAERVQAAKARIAARDLQNMATESPRPLTLDKFDLIAEVKRSSPSEGTLEQPGLDVVAQARGYADAGAAMISVLTEPTRFGGSADDLRNIALDVNVPVMRKDFLVDPYQVLEARAWGASAVLLIARMLDDDTLACMLDAAGNWELTVLLEAFDEEDLARGARAIEGRTGVLLGLNCRDLATLREDVHRFAALLDAFPSNALKIAESGIASAEDAARVARLGYDGVLVGTALMRSQDPAGLARELIDAGRRARA